MTATTPLVGITASITLTRAYLSDVEAFAQGRAASRQRLAGCPGQARKSGPTAMTTIFAGYASGCCVAPGADTQVYPYRPSAGPDGGAYLCARPIEAWGNTMTHTHVPAAASKAQVGMLYCPSFSALKADIY
jgi:hypothetical protein